MHPPDPIKPMARPANWQPTVGWPDMIRTWSASPRLLHCVSRCTC